MRVFLVAGEASGDRLGAALMDGLRELVPDVRFEGVGGPMMRSRGLDSLFPMDELSVMGIAEVLPKYRHLRRRMIETAEAVLTSKPDVLVTIDSPDFCFRMAERVRQRALVRTVHYVAPSVWAWRPGRAARMARRADQVLALLPFEPPYFEAHGLRCDFVGHPVVAEPQPDAETVARFRAETGIGAAPVILALPGSRRSEVDRLATVFGDALRLVSAARPDLRIVLPAAPSVADRLKGLTRDWPETMVIDSGDAGRKAAAFATADAALAASGTVSLELASAGTPMVVAYDMSPLSWHLMKRMALIDTVTLVNLVVGEKVVPEFLGPSCRAGPIADALLGVLDAPNAQKLALDRTMRALGKGGEPPGLRAARAVLDGIAKARD